MEKRIKDYFKLLKPSDLGLNKKIIVKSVKKLGQGTSNLNYLVNINGKKFVIRINANPNDIKKSGREFQNLKMIEKLKISPRPILLEENKNYLGADFLIVDYLEGKTVDNTKIYFSDFMIKNIAKLLAKIHSTKITKDMKNQLTVNPGNPETIFAKVINIYLRYIKDNIQNKRFWKMINESIAKTRKNLKKIPRTKTLVLSQGDFCEQNIVYNKGKFRLIDFEDLELTNPIEQIAHITIDFGKTLQ